MHKSNISSNDNDNSSVDFDFFETDVNRLKNVGIGNEKSYPPKIITKAVIEAKPRDVLENFELYSSKHTYFSKNIKGNELGILESNTNDSLLNPTSSHENRLLSNDIDDMTMFNCLAYSDDINDRQLFITDDKYCSDNSLSDSTITTVTSDFTSVSRLSSMSDSSCGSDLSTDLPITKADELSQNDNVEIISCNNDVECLDSSIEQNKILMLKDVCDDSKEVTNDSKNVSDDSRNDIHGADKLFEPKISEDVEYQKHVHDSEIQQVNPALLKDEETESDDSDCSNMNADMPIHRKNTFHEESIKENMEGSGSLQSNNSSIRKESTTSSNLEERIEGISLASQSNSNSTLVKCHNYRGQNRFRSKRKEFNLTFSREELIKIERDNTILLKKIMAYSKPRSVLLNHTFSHKKTSAAINRARQQKKIEQDNYVLYSKINAMNRLKKVY